MLMNPRFAINMEKPVKLKTSREGRVELGHLKNVCGIVAHSKALKIQEEMWFINPNKN